MTVFFKLRNRQKAISGLNTLRSLQDPAAHKLAEKLDALSATLDAHEAAKQALENALRDYNISVAEQEIEKLQVSPSQRSILKAYLNMYRGRFDEARSELNSVSTTNYAIVQEGLDTLSKAEVNYRSLSEKAYSFLYSPLSVSICDTSESKWMPKLSELPIEEYLSTVAQLAGVAPLDETVMDLVFHTQVLVASEDQLQELGDRFLRAKGTLQIPFYSSDRFFKLVIDSRGQRLRTLDDNHPYVARYAWNGGWHVEHDTKHNRWVGNLIPFDVRFSEIKLLQQNVKSYDGTELKRDVYAVKVDSGGVTPHYAFMAALHCKVSVRATHLFDGSLAAMPSVT